MGRRLSRTGVDQPPASQPGSLYLALHGLCPQCRKGKIFRNPLEFIDACPVCGFEVSKHDNGDGPIFFVIIIVGFLATGIAGWVEYTYEPPFWLHAVLWGPFIIIASVALLRLFKGWMLAAQYKHHLLGNDHDAT